MLFVFFFFLFFNFFSNLLQQSTEAERLQPMRVDFADYFLLNSARSFCLPFARSFVLLITVLLFDIGFEKICRMIGLFLFSFVLYIYFIFAGLTIACLYPFVKSHWIPFPFFFKKKRKKKTKELCFNFIWRLVCACVCAWVCVCVCACASAVQLVPTLLQTFKVSTGETEAVCVRSS